MHAQADSAVCSGCSGRADECSPSAQVKAAAAHVQTLKQNKKLSLTLPFVPSTSYHWWSVKATGSPANLVFLAKFVAQTAQTSQLEVPLIKIYYVKYLAQSLVWPQSLSRTTSGNLWKARTGSGRFTPWKISGKPEIPLRTRRRTSSPRLRGRSRA